MSPSQSQTQPERTRVPHPHALARRMVAPKDSGKTKREGAYLCLPQIVESLFSSPACISPLWTGTFLVPVPASRMPNGISHLAKRTSRIPTGTSSVSTAISILPMESFVHRTRISSIPTGTSHITKPVLHLKNVISDSKPPFATHQLPVATSFFSLATTWGTGRSNGAAANIPHSELPIPHLLHIPHPPDPIP